MAGEREGCLLRPFLKIKKSAVILQKKKKNALTLEKTAMD